MMFGKCRKCGKKDKLQGGLCEDCASEEEAKFNPLNDEREKFSKEELQREIQERRRDKKFWSKF